MKINIPEAIRRLRKLWSDFQHHIILVQLRIDDGHFGLSECAVNPRIKGLCGLSQFRGVHPIVVQADIQTSVLLVGVYVLQPGKFFHLRENSWSPGSQIGNRVGLNGVLI